MNSYLKFTTRQDGGNGIWGNSMPSKIIYYFFYYHIEPGSRSIKSRIYFFTDDFCKVENSV